MKPSVKRGILAACILTAAVFEFNALPSSREIPAGDREPIRIRVGMVSLPVVVTDGSGEYVTDLKKEDFVVFDNGKPQEIAGFAAVEEPISVALMLDTSGSTESQLERIREEAIRFVRLLKKDDALAILSFADEVILWEHFSLYGEKNPEAIRKIRPGGLSAVYEAVWLALEQVLKHEFGRKALVLFSDGIDNRSRTVTEEETLDLARRTESTIYCIYFNTRKDRSGRFPFPGGGTGRKAEYAAGHEYLTKISRYSGGILVDAKKTGDLGPAFRKIAQELSSRYSIGYYPRNLIRNGEFHRVEVRLKKGGLTVRTKQGYFAPDA